MRWLLGFVAILTLSLAPVAQGQTEAAPAPGTTGVTTFGAKTAERPPPAPDDFRGMLAVCDEQREACEKDAVGVPFLAAAYMALWVILLGFLFVVRSGTAKARSEMEELRARLRELEKAAP
ncbi:MAG: hypothetical protein QF464_14715 [Myxococcota bacterium]|jgi:hypothetical protein|nr:hypothetical protein [Myxococcota bacterium]